MELIARDNSGHSTTSRDQEWGARSKEQTLCALLTWSYSVLQTRYATIHQSQLNPTISSNWTEQGETLNWDNGGHSTTSRDWEWSARSKEQTLHALSTQSYSACQTQYATIHQSQLNPTISSNWTEQEDTLNWEMVDTQQPAGIKNGAQGARNKLYMLSRHKATLRAKLNMRQSINHNSTQQSA
eukprot:9454097-Ditylum_brightwellii.AAC.1